MTLPAKIRSGLPCTQCGLPSHAHAVDQAEVEATAGLLVALADPVRLGVVQLLASHDRLCVCEIAPAFTVGQPTISHHLKILREAGLVDVVRRGQWAYYGLRRDAMKRVAQQLVGLL